MEGPDFESRKAHFGNFVLDLRAGELLKNGRKVRLPDQPFRVLAMLLERPGQVVTREELRLRLWPADTFVDFDHGLNNAINRIRESLGDSADAPRYVETLPRRGYRFIGPVDNGQTAEVAQTPTKQPESPWNGIRIAASVGGIAVATLVATFALNIGNLRTKLLGGTTRPQITSIAVLPLENLTGDPQQDYFVDGIHDELITQLAQVSSLKVISRTSVMRYKKEKPPLRQIGEELDVDGVLEGAVRREGDRLHVTAQLIATREDRHVWARSYDRDMREAPAVPGEVARAVAETLNLKLTSQERLLLASAQPVDPAVYTAYLKGKYFAAKYTNEGFHRAIEFFQEAIAKDPGYAPAWAEMGDSYESLSGYGMSGEDLSDQEALQKASAAVERALELDPRLRNPHQVLMRMKLNDWDWEGAAREDEKARELDPAWHGGSYFLTISGRPDEAILAARRSLERDPLGYSMQSVLGWNYFMAERYDESIEALKRAVVMEPANHYAHFQLGWNYAKKAMYPEAVSECDTAVQLLRRTQPEAVAAPDCGWVYALAGRRRQAFEIARTMEKTAVKDKSHTEVAHIYDGLGERETALKFLEAAFRVRDPWLPRQWSQPMISDELRADPRFQELMRRTGNPWIHFPPRGGSLVSAGTALAPKKQP